MAEKLKLCKLGCGTLLDTDETTLPSTQPRKRQQPKLCPECRMAYVCASGRGWCCKCRNSTT